MKRDIKVYVADIIESIAKIEEYMKEVKVEDDFYSNTQVQDAVLRRLEIMGEAVKNIPDKFRAKYSDIPWRKIAGMRDVISHEYFGVNMERTLIVIKQDLASLKNNILKVKEELDKIE